MKRFSKNISSILLVALIAITLIGCSSTAKTEATPEIVVPVSTPVEVVVPEPAPAPEPAPVPVVEEPAPAPAPVVEAPAPEPEVVIVGEMEYAGYKASVSMGSTKAVVEYPAFITIEDIATAYASLDPSVVGYLKGMTYEFLGDGKVELTYPELSKEVRFEVLKVVENAVKSYVNDYFKAVERVKAAELAQAEAAKALEAAKAEIIAKAEAPKAEAPVVVEAPKAEVAEVVVVPAYEKEVPASTKEEIVVVMPAFEVVAVVEEPAPVVVAEPAPAPAPEPAPEPEPEPEPVVEVAAAPEPEVFPYGVTEIIKNTQGDASFDLFIVHTNDAHARIVPADGGMGYAKLSTLIKTGREITDNILVLDAGDVSHGTNLANLFKGETVGVILDMIGYDAVAPGNHDFNYGTDVLLQSANIAAAYSDTRVLAANVVDENGAMIFQPYQIYDFNGFDVAVLGLATPDTKEKAHPNNTKGVEFYDFMDAQELALAQAAIDMANEYADFVIVLGHIGSVADGSSGLTSTYLCENLKGIDLFVDGHSHTVYENGKMVGDTLVVSAGEYLKYAGLVEIHVENGEASITGAMLIPAEDVLNPAESELAAAYGITAIADDAEITAYVDAKTAELDAIYSKVVATIPEDLDGERQNVRTKKTNLSKLITSAMTAYTGADFTITNGGGIRASLKKGDVTLGDINNVLPFTNTISVCEITPAEVYAALEHGYSMLPETNGAYSQTDLQVVYSKYAEPGSRIKRVLLNGELLDKNDTTTVYKVASNDFMAAGGDGYTMFGREIMVGPMLNEVFADYLAELYPPQN